MLENQRLIPFVSSFRNAPFRRSPTTHEWCVVVLLRIFTCKWNGFESVCSVHICLAKVVSSMPSLDCMFSAKQPFGELRKTACPEFAFCVNTFSFWWLPKSREQHPPSFNFCFAPNNFISTVEKIYQIIICFCAK